ncbi:zinc ribbon domain-containing protein [Mobilicoccus caccae]|uniref:C4-type zinc ribbon domain-containing protein n=1 Tax=Mobilicoccus caccae TaxID=1859295 RepID=A0ABQ6IN74_9MICO|nr:C4-type zinc ribbon domain-containing protein [Mobilicoccus caccae]GMA39369.1 hypothetical protein GCM10025883_14140 [Mobilicoccus caccae]
MKANQQLQWRLLDLQGIDTRLAQIAHRTKNLPEALEVSTRSGELAALDSEITRARVDADDIHREATKAEADVTLVRDRATRNQARLDAGQGSAKDMQALTHELDSLARRQGELEEIELEAMERAEVADKRLVALEGRRGPLQETLSEAEAARTAAQAELDREREALERQRTDVAAGITDDLLALYEKIRTTSGTGAAALRHRRCEGCNLELMAADLSRFAKAADNEVLRCEECRRILVRTSESGL